jgi:hypothetical protein
MAKARSSRAPEDMESIAGKSLSLFGSFVAALIVYFLVAIQHRYWPLILLGSFFIVGIALLAAGWAIMGSHPVQAVALVECSIIATVSLATSVIALALWLEEVARRDLALLPPAARDTLIPTVVLLIGVATSFVLVKRGNAIFPAGQTKLAFKSKFRNRLAQGSAGYETVFADYVSGSLSTQGWGLCARIVRARVLAELS